MLLGCCLANLENNEAVTELPDQETLQEAGKLIAQVEGKDRDNESYED
jgi:hypothetical protein